MQRFEYKIATCERWYPETKVLRIQELLDEYSLKGWKVLHFFKENTDGSVNVCFERQTAEYNNYNESIIELLKK